MLREKYIEELEKQFEEESKEALKNKPSIPRKSVYLAADIVKWKLPRQGFNYDWLYTGDLIPGQILLSHTRCMKLKVKVTDQERPAAFRRTSKGYIALYDRTFAGVIDKIFEHEIFGGSYIKCSCGAYCFYKISFHEIDDLARYGGERKTYCKSCGQELIYRPARKVY